MLELLFYLKTKYPKNYHLFFQFLIKNSNVLAVSSKEKLPLLSFEEDCIHLWYKDEIVSAFPFVFSKPEEQIIILQSHLMHQSTIYISSSLPSIFYKEFIKNKLNESILNEQNESFLFWKQFAQIELKK